MSSPYDINVGVLDSLTQNVPAPGADATFTNNAFGRCRLNYISFHLELDANASDRHVRIDLTRGVATWPVGIATIKLTANNAVHAVCAAGMLSQASLSAIHLHVGMPEILLLEPGDTLTVASAGKQAGDAITLIHNSVLVFPIVV